MLQAVQAMLEALSKALHACKHLHNAAAWTDGCLAQRKQDSNRIRSSNVQNDDECNLSFVQCPGGYYPWQQVGCFMMGTLHKAHKLTLM